MKHKRTPRRIPTAEIELSAAVLGAGAEVIKL